MVGESAHSPTRLVLRERVASRPILKLSIVQDAHCSAYLRTKKLFGLLLRFGSKLEVVASSRFGPTYTHQMLMPESNCHSMRRPI